MNDAKVSQSIIAEIENIGFFNMCPHDIVCHDGDETLGIITHAFHMVLLRYLIELIGFIEYEVDRFHYSIALSIMTSNP